MPDFSAVKKLDLSSNPLEMTIGRGDRNDKEYVPNHKTYFGSAISIICTLILFLYGFNEFFKMKNGVNDSVSTLETKVADGEVIELVNPKLRNISFPHIVPRLHLRDGYKTFQDDIGKDFVSENSYLQLGSYWFFDIDLEKMG